MTDSDEVLGLSGAFFYRGRIAKGGYNPTAYTTPAFARPAIFFTQTEFDDFTDNTFDEGDFDEYGEMDWRNYGGSGDFDEGDFE